MPDEHFAAGRAALQLGDWSTAKNQLELSLGERETAEAHDGLGIVLWWLNQIPASHRERATAYNAYRQQGDLHLAAVIAAWLAREQVFLYSNTSAMNGWFARAERLIGQVGDCVELGWVRLYHDSMLGTPQELEATATYATISARRFGDSSLEALAMAFQGNACVQQNRINQGLALVDEAMAAVTGGEVGNLMAISEIFCVTLSTCELAGDTVHAEHWCLSAAEFARQYQCSFLSAYCRTTYGSLLMESGRWQAAEEELTDAILQFDSGHMGLRVHAQLKLADLRVSQGRLEEAEILLTGYEDHRSAALPLARLHLARGEFAPARVVLEQALSVCGRTSLTAAPLLTHLIEVQFASGALADAEQTAKQLTDLAQAAQNDLLLAQIELIQGQMKRKRGEGDPISSFQNALDRLRNYNQSLLASRTRLEMAYTLQTSDPIGSGVWAKAALASFTRLGAAHEAAEAAKLLRELGISSRRGARGREDLTQRESEVLALLAAGLSNREIAQRLVISVKTVEHHVSQVLGKTGLRSRAEAAAYVVSRKQN